jgi:hypothetical protein
MILGAAIENNTLLLAGYSGRDTEPQFCSFPLAENYGDQDKGSVWAQAGEEARKMRTEAEQIIFAVPTEYCYLKRIGIEKRLVQGNSEHLDWVAGNHLPGGLDNYHYNFVTLRQSYNGIQTEMLLYATMSRRHDKLNELLNPGGKRPVIFLPEQIGLVQVVEMSLKIEEFPQAGIVNCHENGIVAVYAREGRFDHSRLFSSKSAQKNEIAADIETYFLSRADVSEPLPLIITGFTGRFTTGWSPVIPAFMGIHNLEYAGAWGVADFISRGIAQPSQGPVRG